MRIFYLITIFCLIPLASEAGTGAEMYQEALLLEKGKGELASALAIYQSIIDRYEEEQTDALWAAQSQTRLGIIRDRLGLATSKEVPIEPSQTDVPDLLTSVSAQRLQSLRNALGLRTLSERLTSSEPMSESEFHIHSGLDQQVTFRARLGLHGLPELLSDPNAYLETAPRISTLEQELKDLFTAIGLHSIPEKMAILEKNKRLQRPWQPLDFYHAGLIMEKGQGNLSAAVELYQKAFQVADRSDPALAERLQRRLLICQNRLAENPGL